MDSFSMTQWLDLETLLSYWLLKFGYQKSLKAAGRGRTDPELNGHWRQHSSWWTRQKPQLAHILKHNTSGGKKILFFNFRMMQVPCVSTVHQIHIFISLISSSIGESTSPAKANTLLSSKICTPWSYAALRRKKSHLSIAAVVRCCNWRTRFHPVRVSRRLHCFLLTPIILHHEVMWAGCWYSIFNKRNRPQVHR